MGMTMTQKILAKHAGVDSVKAGDLINCRLDLVMANDITAPPSIAEFKRIGVPVFDKEKIVLVPDHFQPAKDIKSAGLAKIVRDFAHENGIVNYFEQGRVGIEHALLPEKGLVGPGMVTIGADSHTCTYGALGGFSTGVGSTDLGVAMATGEAWFKVPDAIKVALTGTKPEDITGKDVILTLIGMIGVDGALYQSLEFTGPGVHSLSMTDRFTIANMAIEAGGKNGIFPVDEKTIAYIEGRYHKPFDVVEADEDAHYSRVVEIDLSSMKPVVSFPHLPKIRRSSAPSGRSRSTRWSSVPARTAVSRIWLSRPASSRGIKSIRMSAASSSRRHRRFTCRPCMPASSKPSSMPDVPCLHRPAARALAVTWGSLQMERNAYPPRIETSSAAWDRPILKFIWQALRWQRPALS